MAAPAPEIVARHAAYVGWLSANGFEEAAAWHRANPEESFWETFVEVVAERAAPGYVPAAALAPGHLAAVEDIMGPPPSDPDEVGPYLDRLVDRAVNRVRTQIGIWIRENPPVERYHTEGRAGSVAPASIRPHVCTVRRGSSRATRSTRRVVRSRGSATRAGPLPRRSSDDDPHDVVEHARLRGGSVHTSARGRP